jgi:hypothetical protein
MAATTHLIQPETDPISIMRFIKSWINLRHGILGL